MLSALDGAASSLEGGEGWLCARQAAERGARGLHGVYGRLGDTLTARVAQNPPGGQRRRRRARLLPSESSPCHPACPKAASLSALVGR